MITKILKYRDAEQIKAFIRKNSLSDNSQLLIQIFTGKNSLEEIKSIQFDIALFFKKATIIGATADSVISEGKMLSSEDTVIIFSQFENSTLGSIFINSKDNNQDSFTLGERVASEIILPSTRLLITFTDSFNTDGEEYIQGVSLIAPDTVIAGGMAGNNVHTKNTYVFNREEVTGSGVVAVAIYNESLYVSTNYSFDWSPIGRQLHVTKVKDNRVYEIDGISAVGVYKKYLGKDFVKRLPESGYQFPLVVERDGIIVGRTVLEKYDDGSLAFSGNIEENEKVHFAVGNIGMMLKGSFYHVENISNHPVETIFIYSCMARRHFLGKNVDTEMLPFAKLAPTSGFFTFGEFFHNRGESKLLNQSMTTVAISESKKMSKPLKRDDVPMSISSGVNVSPLHVISHFVNVVSKELESLNKTLEKRIRSNTDYILNQVYTEELTKLPNRLKLIKDLTSQKNAYILLINIDDFNLINDFYGHAAGDYVLKNLANKIRQEIVGHSATLYKLPSDEFAIIYKNITKLDEITNFVKILVDDLGSSVFTYEDNSIHVSVTIAAAKINDEGIALAQADMTLKVAKRNEVRYMIFNDSMMLSKRYKENLQIANSVRHAILNDNIIPYFQPIFNMRTNEIEKYECLARLVKDDGSIISPIDFIPVAKKIRLYPEITKIVLEKSFKKFAGTAISFTVNLSIDDILEKQIREHIYERIVHYDVGSQVVFEILETQQIENDETVNEFIRVLRKLGGKIAIDDFGSGFANFEHMTRIDVDIIKIDGSLIKSIDSDKNVRLVVETIVTFAKKLGIKTVAEFVHSKEVLKAVNELYIDFGQGFLLGKPHSELCEK